MRIFANRKALELGINAIIIIAIALLALIVVSAFFLGGFGKMGGAISGIGGEAEEEAEESDIGGEIEGISELWETGVCSGTFDCNGIRNEYTCNSLVAIGKCNRWYGGYRCDNGRSVSCSGLPEETCTAISDCTWTLE